VTIVTVVITMIQITSGTLHNYFHLENQTSAILKFFGFDLNHMPMIGLLFCIKPPNFIQIRPSDVISIFKMAAAVA